MKIMDDEENVKDLLDDDDIRKYFQGRDPTRAKTYPFLTEESEEQYKGKSSSLTTKVKEEKEEVYGVSFTQYTKQLREVSRHFLWIGMSVAFFIAIIITLIF